MQSKIIPGVDCILQLIPHFHQSGPQSLKILLDCTAKAVTPCKLATKICPGNPRFETGWASEYLLYLCLFLASINLYPWHTGYHDIKFHPKKIIMGGKILETHGCMEWMKWIPKQCPWINVGIHIDRRGPILPGSGGFVISWFTAYNVGYWPWREHDNQTGILMDQKVLWSSIRK